MQKNGWKAAGSILLLVGFMAAGILAGDRLAQQVVWPAMRPQGTAEPVDVLPNQEKKLGEVTLQEASFSAVSMYTDLDLKNAQVFAQKIVEQGGAGYVFAREGYHVLAAAYQKAEDADAVSESLKTAGWDCQVIQSTGNAVRFVVTGTELEINMLSTTAAFIHQTMTELETWAADLDTQTSTAADTRSLALERLSQIRVHRERMLGLQRQSEDSRLISGLLALLEVEEQIFSGITAFGDTQSAPMAQKIRYGHIQALLKYQELTRALVQ